MSQGSSFGLTDLSFHPDQMAMINKHTKQRATFQLYFKAGEHNNLLLNLGLLS